MKATLRKLTTWARWKLRDLRFFLVDRWLTARHRGDRARLFADLPPLQGELPEAGADPVIFCAADPHYFASYAGWLADSIAAHSRTARLHVHLYAVPGETESAVAATLAGSLGPGRLTVSFEAFDDARWRGGQRRTLYFQTVRFARLAEIAERTRGAFFAIDADLLFLAPPERLTAPCDGMDIAAKLQPWEASQGWKFRAGAIYLGATAAARDYLRKAAARMLLHLFRGPEIWLLDQRCLHAELRQARKGLRLAQLPAEALHDDPAVATLYSKGGAGKTTTLPSVAIRHLPAGANFLACALESRRGSVQGIARTASAEDRQQGYLTYGPYFDLPPGRYRVAITYSATGKGHGWNLASEAGERVLARGALADSGGEPRSVILPVRLAEKAVKLELRTRVGDTGRLTVWSIRLRPAAGPARRPASAAAPAP